MKKLLIGLFLVGLFAACADDTAGTSKAKVNIAKDNVSHEFLVGVPVPLKATDDKAGDITPHVTWALNADAKDVELTDNVIRFTKAEGSATVSATLGTESDTFEVTASDTAPIIIIVKDIIINTTTSDGNTGQLKAIATYGNITADVTNAADWVIEPDVAGVTVDKTTGKVTVTKDVADDTTAKVKVALLANESAEATITVVKSVLEGLVVVQPRNYTVVTLGLSIPLVTYAIYDKSLRDTKGNRIPTLYTGAIEWEKIGEKHAEKLLLVAGDNGTATITGLIAHTGGDTVITSKVGNITSQAYAIRAVATPTAKIAVATTNVYGNRFIIDSADRTFVAVVTDANGNQIKDLAATFPDATYYWTILEPNTNTGLLEPVNTSTILLKPGDTEILAEADVTTLAIDLDGAGTMYSETMPKIKTYTVANNNIATVTIQNTPTRPVPFAGSTAKTVTTVVYENVTVGYSPIPTNVAYSLKDGAGEGWAVTNNTITIGNNRETAIIIVAVTGSDGEELTDEQDAPATAGAATGEPPVITRPAGYPVDTPLVIAGAPETLKSFIVTQNTTIGASIHLNSISFLSSNRKIVAALTSNDPDALTFTSLNPGQVIITVVGVSTNATTIMPMIYVMPITLAP